MSVLLDSGVILAMDDARDQHHQAAVQLAAEFALRRQTLFVAWPVIYEAVGTRAVRRGSLPRFRETWRRLQRQGMIELIDDAPYRDAALEASFDPASTVSIVDGVLRAIIADRKRQRRVGSIATFNRRDFIDVCVRYGVAVHPLG